MLKLFSQYKGLRKENYVLFVGSIVTNLGSMIWPVITMILNQKLGMNATTVALVMIGAGIIQMPFSLLGGKLADSHNKKNIIVLFDLISVIFYIGCAFFPLSFKTIVVLLIASTLQTIEGPAYNALIADITVTKDREKAFSLSYLGKNIGLVASPTIAGFLFKKNLSLSFAITGVAILVSTILILLFVKDIVPEKEEETAAMAYQDTKEGESTIKILLSNKVMILYMILMAFFWGAYNQYGYLMPLDMGRVHGEDGAIIYGTVSSLNCITVVLLTPVLTKLTSNISYTKRTLISVVLTLVGYIVFLMGLGFIPSYYLAIFLFTLGEILSCIVSGPYMTERIPASHRGRLNSVMGIFQSILMGGMMYLVGYLFDYFGSVTAWTFVFLVLAATIVGVLVLIKWDRVFYKDLYTEDK